MDRQNAQDKAGAGLNKCLCASSILSVPHGVAHPYPALLLFPWQNLGKSYSLSLPYNKLLVQAEQREGARTANRRPQREELGLWTSAACPLLSSPEERVSGIRPHTFLP